jgi:hypothetical protein
MFVEPFPSTEVGGLMSYGARIADAMRQATAFGGRPVADITGPTDFPPGRHPSLTCMSGSAILAIVAHERFLTARIDVHHRRWAFGGRTIDCLAIGIR